LGGYAHLAALVKRLKAQRKQCLLLDGGDSWQGSATSLWTNAQDMVDANLLLGVDVMTGHWEFTYGAERVVEIVNKDFKDKLEFVAHNIVDTEFGDSVFKPYVIKEVNQIPVAIIGQAFPYTPIANPSHMFPKWSFGIREQELQSTVNHARKSGAQLAVLLSHNGMDVDIKLATRISGLDVILGGHTHDAVPQPLVVNNPNGKTLVINSGSAGKFLSVLDLQVTNKKLVDFRYRLLPVFSNYLPADPQMQSYIDSIRNPYKTVLHEKLATTENLLYRRGTFNGSFDQIILNGLMEVMDAEIAFSPGFRWGMTVLPGSAITFEDLMTQTAITYPIVTLNNLSGQQIKYILEDVADNIFHHDPYYQQGGDMVRVGGLTYSIDPNERIGNRISDMRINNKRIHASKKYKVAGWASVNPHQDGTPVWDVIANYLRAKKTISITDFNLPHIKNMTNNPGVAI
jgi:sulfur-oxidizing protein SoxB